ncbi:hypothetical protein RhiirA1_259923 [Rhizophagus irregularis]|uniref:Uncharacterized protein n=1 Tax=Rhizophagus irregularis TaxID=588596 RepID=A0A2N0SD24_9GLOM|nr:hypothetical protein RhiirA1_259923 [Rhizophagus irregularis]
MIPTLFWKLFLWSMVFHLVIILTFFYLDLDIYLNELYCGHLFKNVIIILVN